MNTPKADGVYDAHREYKVVEWDGRAHNQANKGNKLYGALSSEGSHPCVGCHRFVPYNQLYLLNCKDDVAYYLYQRIVS